jgi:hypothetical protein
VAIAGGEPPFAQSFYGQDLVADWPTGQYRLTASFVEGGVAAQGRESVFFVTDDKEMPAVPEPVIVWGEDPVVSDWLKRERIATKPFDPGNSSQRELILVGRTPRQGNPVAEFKELCRHIGRGAAVVFLDHRVFANGKNTTAWAPLSSKGTIGNTPNDLYIRDQWIKDHPLFARMPNKGPMDHVYYRHLLRNFYWSNAEKPVAAVAGDVCTCWAHAGAYKSGLHVAVYELGAGRFILNTLDVRGNLGRDPAAELLLRNMLNYASREVTKPAVALPSDFEQSLDKIYPGPPIR